MPIKTPTPPTPESVQVLEARLASAQAEADRYRALVDLSLIHI